MLIIFNQPNQLHLPYMKLHIVGTANRRISNKKFRMMKCGIAALSLFSKIIMIAYLTSIFVIPCSIFVIRFFRVSFSIRLDVFFNGGWAYPPPAHEALKSISMSKAEPMRLCLFLPLLQYASSWGLIPDPFRGNSKPHSKVKFDAQVLCLSDRK